MVVDAANATPDPRESKRYYLENTATRKLITSFAWVVFKISSKTEASGVENLPAQGPVVLASNHLTNYDVFPMQLSLPRLVFFMGKVELFSNPLSDFIFRRLGGFPVNRGQNDEWAARYAIKVLEAGEVLGIFPEGKRSKGHGLHTGKTGAARFALNANAPILPVGVEGTDEMFARFPRRTPVTIRVGQPIYPLVHESPIALTDRLMYSIADLLPQRLRGVYGHRPARFSI
jgi:1-acyl-sn-glycerol-3-phosphate acyltransferase